LDNERLVEILQSGSREEFIHIMQAYNKLLWVIVGGVLSGVGSAEDMEECISDIYVALWRDPKSYDPQKGSLKTFIATIAKHRAIDKYRQLTKNRYVEFDDAVGATTGDLLDPIIKHDLYDSLYEAIGTLKEPDKEIVIRRYFFDEMPAGIAKRISIPVKEVKNRLYQSKLRLKKTLQKM